MLKKNVLIWVCVLGVSLPALAQQAKPSDLIRARQASYTLIGWNAGRIKSNLDGQFSKEEVIKAANVIQSIANSGLGSLFPPGTETGNGFHETRVKPALFDPANAAKVAEVAGNFNRQANELSLVASRGDKDAVKVQFGKLRETCKACHDNFKLSD